MLTTSAWKTILLDAFDRQQIEACGVLLGAISEAGSWSVQEAFPLRNAAASPVYFEFDPLELLSIDLAHPGRVIGVYHSHPGGPTVASSTDRQNMRRVNIEQQIPWVWLIVSGPFLVTSPAAGPHLDAAADTQISIKGMVAYHHYGTAGLQKISIEHHDEIKR